MTRRTSVLALGAAIIAAVSLTACTAKADQPAEPTPPGTEGPTIVIPYDELLNQKTVTRSVTLKVGDTLQVSLGSSPSTGFGWAPKMTIPDATVLLQTGHEPIGPAENRPGAPASEVWALQAVGPGTTTASTTYSRPWEGGEKDVWTFTVTATVK